MSLHKSEVIASGSAIAPAGGAIIADSGQLPAGVYDIEISLAFAAPAAVGQGLIVQHRNAANGANVQELGGTSSGCSDFIILRDYAIALNERIRVVGMAQAGAVNSEAHAMVRCRATK